MLPNSAVFKELAYIQNACSAKLQLLWLMVELHLPLLTPKSFPAISAQLSTAEVPELQFPNDKNGNVPQLWTFHSLQTSEVRNSH